MRVRVRVSVRVAWYVRHRNVFVLDRERALRSLCSCGQVKAEVVRCWIVHVIYPQDVKLRLFIVEDFRSKVDAEGTVDSVVKGRTVESTYRYQHDS